MHEATRRQICRLLFVLLCLVPTGGVCSLIVYQRSSIGAAARRGAWEAAIFERLGIEAHIEQLVEVAPGVVLLEGVELRDPDGDQRVARIRLLEVYQSGHGIALRASQPHVDAGRLDRLFEVLHERVLRGPPLPTSCELFATEVTLAGRSDAHTLSHIRCVLEPGEGEPTAQLEFQVAGVDMATPAELQIIRNRKATPPVTGWRLRTGATPLPCSLLADYVPPLGLIGGEARFVGSVWIERSANGWNGEVAGTLNNVALDELLKSFPHKLSGVADLELKRVRLRNGKLEEVVGKVDAPGGVISRSLLAGLTDAFDIAADDTTIDADARLLQYQQLAFEFELDRAGLRLSGACDDQPDALITSSNGVLLPAPADELLPAVALTRALVPESDLLVPASRQTVLLFRALPLPASIAPAETANGGYAPLRLRN